MVILLGLAVLILVRRLNQEETRSCVFPLSSLTMQPCHQFADVSSHLLGILRGPLGLPLRD
jgi:hypothetical protein